MRIRKRLFIVDDDEMQSEMLADHLSSHVNLDIEIFSTGEACLDALDKNPSLIILDINLNSIHPKAANGIEILQIIKKKKNDIRVIMYSSQKQQGEALRLVEENTLEFVIKNQEAFNNISNIIDELF